MRHLACKSWARWAAAPVSGRAPASWLTPFLVTPRRWSAFRPERRRYSWRPCFRFSRSTPARLAGLQPQGWSSNSADQTPSEASLQLVWLLRRSSQQRLRRISQLSALAAHFLPRLRLLGIWRSAHLLFPQGLRALHQEVPPLEEDPFVFVRGAHHTRTHNTKLYGFFFCWFVSFFFRILKRYQHDRGDAFVIILAAARM